MPSPIALFARRSIVIEVALILLMTFACSDAVRAPVEPVVTPNVVDVSFCNSIAPLWVAFQDGDGAWTRAQPQAASAQVTYRLTLSANHGGIATAQRFNSGMTALTVRYGAPSELAIAGDIRPEVCNSQVGRTVLGTVAGLDTNEIAVVSAGRSGREVTSFAEDNVFSLHSVQAGPQEILATRLTHRDGNTSLTGVILRRSPDLLDGATIPVLDFNSPEAMPPVVRTATLVGANGAGAFVFSGLRTAHSEDVITSLSNDVVTTVTPYSAVPEAALGPGDLQFLSATNSPAPGSNVARSAFLYFRSPTNRTLTFGAPPSAPELSIVSAVPTLRLRAHFAVQADYDRLTSINYQQGQNTIVSVAMTPMYAELAGSGYALIVPDLAGVEGFDPQWALRPDAAILWTVSRIGGSLGVAPGVVRADGSTRVIATDAGNLIPSTLGTVAQGVRGR